MNLHPSVLRILTLRESSFQMLEICSNPTLDMSCCQLNARGKRVTRPSQASICSMMHPHSYPVNVSDGCEIDSTEKEIVGNIINIL